MKSLAAIALTLVVAAPAAATPGMARVGAGTYRPVFPPSPAEKEIAISAFELDRKPVTNREYLAFVRSAPKWRRDRVARIFADPGYLARWSSELALGDQAPANAPVTHVSWFAAKAYCESKGKRLPTEQEWEYAAAASEKQADARQDPEFTARILGWYGNPTPAVLPHVGSRAPNVWGVSDLHGLVWEWVSDFGNTLVSGDARESGNPDKMKFCGASALSASDKSDYASFMRIAFRSSLKAPFTTGNLGFRCAKDLPAAGAARKVAKR